MYHTQLIASITYLDQLDQSRWEADDWYASAYADILLFRMLPGQGGGSVSVVASTGIKIPLNGLHKRRGDRLGGG